MKTENKTTTKDTQIELAQRIQKIAQEYTPHHCNEYSLGGYMPAIKFVEIYGEEAGRDLIAAVNWFTAEGYEKDRIAALVNHDLNGVFDQFPECFLPRSSGYGKHWACSPHNPTSFEQPEELPLSDPDKCLNWAPIAAKKK